MPTPRCRYVTAQLTRVVCYDAAGDALMLPRHTSAMSPRFAYVSYAVAAIWLPSPRRHVDGCRHAISRYLMVVTPAARPPISSFRSRPPAASPARASFDVIHCLMRAIRRGWYWRLLAFELLERCD